MKRRHYLTTVLLAVAIVTCFASILSADPLSKTQKEVSREEKMTAKGHFSVQLTPKKDAEFEAGRMTIDKQYQGDLAGTGQGQMLSSRSEVQGSAGYVAIEHVVGSLNGRSGSFTLQHVGVMSRGKSSLSVSVVPDSGTGELKGLSGKMTIEQSKGEHAYEFDYSLDVKSE